MKNIESFLKKIGVPSSTIAKLTAEDEIDVEPFVNGFKSSMQDVFSNDPSFIQPIKDEVRGTELSKIEHKVKKTFSLSNEEVKDKKFDEIINLAFEKMRNTPSQGAEELQNKLIELTKENKRLLEEVIPAKESESQNAIKQYKKANILRSTLSKRDLIVKPDAILPAVESFLSSKYDYEVLDSGEIEVKTKNGLKPLNQDGTKSLTFDELIDSHLSELQVIKQSNAGAAPAQAKPNAVTNESPKFNLPHLEKAQANAERLASMKTFGKE
jgi:cell fate (sporulation/competence/biofilm development) regulator YmcA (YheA/YmcA/DUF963 family)